MVLRTRLAACTAVIAALAVPVASASAAPAATAATTADLGSPRCPDGYSGPTNLATGCPFWVMVTDTGQPWPWWLVH
jgi:hypothetical protein